MINQQRGAGGRGNEDKFKEIRLFQSYPLCPSITSPLVLSAEICQFKFKGYHLLKWMSFWILWLREMDHMI